MLLIQAEEKFGPVFMLVNSAGTSVSRSFQDLDAAEFKVIFNVNITVHNFKTKSFYLPCDWKELHIRRIITLHMIILELLPFVIFSWLLFVWTITQMYLKYQLDTSQENQSDCGEVHYTRTTTPFNDFWVVSLYFRA